MGEAHDGADDRRAVGPSGDEADARAGGALARAEHVVELASGRRIEAAAAGAGADLVRIRGRDGACVLTVEITDHGPVLRFEGAALEIVAPRSLDVACGALRIDAAEGASIRGKSLDLEATAGTVRVKANDDVRVDGERVLLNSSDPPLPISWDEYLERQKAREAEPHLLPRPRPKDEG
ncbi:MAG TPA: hypothetical protein VHB21_24765 [Minicystis sp.]|nr:hypothetical protein [Minicystis sp.]